jgi:hypothetical protein
MLKIISAVSLQDLAKLLGEDYMFVFLRFVQEVRNQLLMEFVKVQFVIKDVDAYRLADFEFLVDDAAEKRMT